MKGPALKLKTTKKYGRGLYSDRDIRKGEVVESSPVLTIDSWESKLLSSTKLNLYVFAWGEGSAFAFGNGSLFNHSSRHNVTYSNCYETNRIVFRALRNIKKGAQLFINYGYDPEYGIRVTKRNKSKAQNADASVRPVRCQSVVYEELGEAEKLFTT